MQNFKNSLKFRHACKIFDTELKISQSDFDEIIEAGRLSPSSFNMQGWKFLQIKNKQIRQDLKEFCWNQPQITDSSELLVILARTNSLLANSKRSQEMMNLRKDKTQSEIALYMEIYSKFIQGVVGESKKELFAWSKAQCFLAAQNMMSMAAILGIDTCPIEGFDPKKVKEILKIEDEFEVALMIAFGYRKNKEEVQKIRLEKSEIFSII